ncbi:hypothetical protein Syun_003875 [Stephania yunnanensis]|uniref:Uncharacterized protein n=1 Tax=Stephania yunnanensis TaxID=152371 RepID=A0AAP0L1Z2_9MAGN
MHHHSDRRRAGLFGGEAAQSGAHGGDRRARDGESWRERQIQMVELARARRRERRRRRARDSEMVATANCSGGRGRRWRRRDGADGETT